MKTVVGLWALGAAHQGVLSCFLGFCSTALQEVDECFPVQDNVARVVVRALRSSAKRCRLPSALWWLTRLETLRISRLVCLSAADIAALQSLVGLRHLTVALDAWAMWRFPSTLETLELATCVAACLPERPYVRWVPNQDADTFRSLTALRRLAIDVSAVNHLFRMPPCPPNLTSFDYVGSLHMSQAVESLAHCRELASFRCTDHLDGSRFWMLGRRPGLRRLHLSTFDATIPHGAASAVVAGGLFATLRDLTLPWGGIDDGRDTRRLADEIACMPALGRLCVQNYCGESLRGLTRGVAAGGYRTLTALAVVDAPRFATLAGIECFAATLLSLEVSSTALRETSTLSDLTRLVRLRLDDARPTVAKNITYPAAPMPAVRHLSIRGSDHWRWTARQTFPSADITPPLTGTEISPRLVAAS